MPMMSMLWHIEDVPARTGGITHLRYRALGYVNDAPSSPACPLPLNPANPRAATTMCSNGTAVQKLFRIREPQEVRLAINRVITAGTSLRQFGQRHSYSTLLRCVVWPHLLHMCLPST